MTRTVVLCFVLCLTGFSCGGVSDSSDSGTVSAEQAKADCYSFIDANFCPKAMTCGAGISQADCVSAARTAINCDIATGENGELPSCKADLAAETCTIFWDGTNFTSPASCQHVFLHP
jgi:hypothetical protein